MSDIHMHIYSNSESVLMMKYNTDWVGRRANKTWRIVSDICRPGCLYRGMSRIFINWLNILSWTDTASVWSLASLILLYWPQNFLVFSIHITHTFNLQYTIYKIQYYLQYLCRGWQERLRLSVRRIRCSGCGVNTSKLIIHHL